MHRNSSPPQERSVVWLYPDRSGDEASSFLMADGECKRLVISALGGKSKACRYLQRWFFLMDHFPLGISQCWMFFFFSFPIKMVWILTTFKIILVGLGWADGKHIHQKILKVGVPTLGQTGWVRCFCFPLLFYICSGLRWRILRA